MASCATILSLQRTPVAGRAPSHVVQPVKRRQPREARAGALGDMDVATFSATSAAQLQGAEAVDPSVYIGLGLLLASFVGTFGVAPMFKSSFKEQDRWLDIYAELTTTMGGVPSLEPEEAAKKAENGAVLMDVRLAHKFDSLACPNSRSFPLYQPISGMGLAANIRRAGFTFFGVFGTERNIQWLEEVEAEIPKDQEIVVVCEHGGNLQSKTGAETGFQSQSLKAAYYLKKAGYTKVMHMKGGLAEYQRAVADLVPGDEALAY